MTSEKSSSLVVIGGWLGSRPKQLKRYEELYNSLGFDTLPVVASPLSVVGSTLHLQSSHRNKIGIPTSTYWYEPAVQLVSEDNLQDLAWKILRCIYTSRAEIFIFHSFSNGGCFLWESVCRALLQKSNTNCDRETTEILEKLYRKCKGVVFDSCPCWFDPRPGSSSRLWEALQYCSIEERQRVISVYGARIKTTDNDVANRNKEYFQYLATVPLDAPQLYLFCKNDELCNHEQISKIIETRRSRQNYPIMEQVWDESIHCNHLRVHRDDYTKAVKDFVKQIDASCLNKARL